jgi:hypothetical protein
LQSVINTEAEHFIKYDFNFFPVLELKIVLVVLAASELAQNSEKIMWWEFLEMNPCSS